MLDQTDTTTEGERKPLKLTVIVPARNEEASLDSCLESLLRQSEPGFALGAEWELIVIDDDSTDGTRDIAESLRGGHPGVEILSPPPLDPASFTGKNNACWAGAQRARGAWLLFTDADTVHEPGDMSRALHEAQKYHAALLSYSPRQIVNGFWQRAVMPLVFSELASVYPPRQVSDPAYPIAAANGQFLLIERHAYFAVGGHRTVGREILEDVALANVVKRAKYGLRFRYAPEALSTRMYRTLPEMIDGWTKNLALLFPSPILLATMRITQFLLFFGLPLLAWGMPMLVPWQRWAILLVWMRASWGFYRRVSRSHFPAADIAVSILGVPLFASLLVRSYMRRRFAKSVQWKGRSYRVERGGS